MIQIGQHFLFEVISGYNVGSSAYAIFLLFVGSGSDEDEAGGPSHQNPAVSCLTTNQQTTPGLMPMILFVLQMTLFSRPWHRLHSQQT